MKTLRPIWSEKFRQEREKGESQGWLEWLKSNMTSFKQWVLRKIS